ncbi:MAG: hypothetical protein K9J06_05545 [Flavobacteriales bacterium]|nr:hypothetical protein [Flavobacteriales bacterium]
METPSSFTAPDILITASHLAAVSLEKEKQELHIDLRPYFPEACCFEVVAVQSLRWHRSRGTFIDNDRCGLTYIFSNEDHHWDDEDASDTLEYVVREHGTGHTASGIITVQCIAPAHFEAVDIHYMIALEDMMPNGRRPRPIEMSLGLVNKFDEVEVVEVGIYDRKLFSSIRFDADMSDTLIFDIETACSPWYSEKRTELEYAIRAFVDGEYGIAKGKITFEVYSRGFYAEMIHMEMSDPLPSEKLIDVRKHNPNFANISLIDVGDTVTVRGAVNHVGGFMVQYVPNGPSGFWDDANTLDAVSYTLRNDITGQEASNYIILKKSAPTVISGGGSGHGGGLGEDLLD